jgi:hypothetical protein
MPDARTPPCLEVVAALADPQRRVPRARPGAGLFGVRLLADLRALVLAARAGALAARRPQLLRLAAALALELPPGRAHRIARMAGDECFGETPLVSACRILEDAGVRPGQRLIELGCGPGRVSLVAAALFGMRCEAVDRVAGFVTRGNRLALRLGLPVNYRQVDLFEWTGAEADWVYVAATGFPSSLRSALAARLRGSGAAVLAVTAPLGIGSHASRRLGKYSFTWGAEQVFIERPLGGIARTRSR